MRAAGMDDDTAAGAGVHAFLGAFVADGANGVHVVGFPVETMAFDPLGGVGVANRLHQHAGHDGGGSNRGGGKHRGGVVHRLPVV